MPDSAANSSSSEKHLLNSLCPPAFYTIFREEKTFLALIGLAVSITLAVSINLKIEADIVNFLSG